MMKDYKQWTNVDTTSHEEVIFSMCEKAYVNINNSFIKYEGIINDANEWQKNIDSIILIEKSVIIIKMGDRISYDDSDYLIIFEPEDRDFFLSGKMRKCNNILKFYNDFVLIETPCIIGNGGLVTGSIGLDYNTLIDTANNKFTLTIPANINTNTIVLGDRFVLNKRLYEVVGIDDIVEKELINIKIKTTNKIEDDNIELGIANYYSNQIARNVEILNGEHVNMIYPSTTLQLQTLVDENDMVIDNPVLAYISSDTDIIEVDTAGLVTVIGTGDATVTVQYKDAMSVINVHSMISLVDGYSITITPDDSSIKVTTSLTYNATPKKNGVDDMLKNVTWSIRNEDGSNNQYVVIVEDNKTCMITCDTVPNKYVILRAELEFDPSIYEEIQIKTANLF